ncbi:MAG: limonene-1,2-epoxide hydrolase family protein [Thermodesulfobacteriota bacterium]
MTPEETVRKFCAAVARRDVKELAGFFTEDAVYHNIPLAPVTGRAAIEATLAQFVTPASSVEFEMRALATAGNVVLTERIDRFVMNGKTIALPVMGAFEVTADGKISAWRDYFDMQQFTSQLG